MRLFIIIALAILLNTIVTTAAQAKACDYGSPGWRACQFANSQRYSPSAARTIPVAEMGTRQRAPRRQGGR